jgi:hypothetical protein
MGKKSAHVVSQEFTLHGDFKAPFNLSIDIVARRSESWKKIGLEIPKLHAQKVGVGASHGDVTKSLSIRKIVPQLTQVHTDRNRVRDVRKKESILAAIEGGNFLSNGADRGSRVYLVGLDSVAATRSFMGNVKATARTQFNTVSFDTAKDKIRDQLHLEGNDILLFIEQPTYHIDMSMMFVSEKTVILNDCNNFANTYMQDDLDEMGAMYVRNTIALENHVADVLKQGGLEVIRKAWASPIPGELNHINGEFVSTPHSENGLFLTTGGFGLSDENVRTLKKM